MTFSSLLRTLPLLLIATVLIWTEATYAQTAVPSVPPQPQPSYQAVILNSLSTQISLVNNSYIVHENGRNLSAQDIEEMIRDGSLINQRLRSEHIFMGRDGHGIWIVMPVVNNSMSRLWELNLGNLKDGRLSSLDDVALYNMNSHQYIINTKDQSTKSQSITSTISLEIPQGQTTFFFVYLKSAAAIPNYITPSLSLPSQSGFSHLIDFLNGLLCVALAFSVGVYFFKSAGSTKSGSQLALGLMWIAISIPLALSVNFLYVDWRASTLYPAIWIIIPLSLMISFILHPSSRENLPINILVGFTSLVLICGLVGLILLNSLTTISSYLIYGSAAASMTAICLMCWGSFLRENRKDYLAIAYCSFFFLALLAWTTLLHLELIPATGLLTYVSEFLFIAALLASIGASNPIAVSEETETSPTLDIFVGNQLNKRDSQKIVAAKEQSEHHRLMQVIEQERKLMSELQVKTAQQNEEMRRAKEAADEANRAKSAFLAVVSHEIRTPMTGIMGMLRLLQETQLSKEQRDYASTIKDSGDAMLALLNDILDFEKIESGKMDLEDINFDLKRLVRGVHTLMTGHAESKGIELVLELDPNAPTWVRGDPTRLRQVLLNLINNAIKFTSKGSVYLRVRDLTGNSEDKIQKTHQIYFAIQDSGIGIGPESQKKLFMPFAQADSSISRKYGGTGLGLAICKRLIEAMGGAISINSKEGEGSTFFFTVSMPEGMAQTDSGANDFSNLPEKTTDEKPRFKSPINVLVVDDNGINLKVVSGFVEKLGCHPMTAANGEDALDMLSRYPFDLILMDLQLPDMTGIDVTKIIRDLPLPGKANVPIVALTGNGSDEDKKACLESGMNDFAVKPITYEKILELLLKVDDQSYFNKKTGPITFDYSKQDDDESSSSPPIENEPAQTTPQTSKAGPAQREDEVIFSDTDTSFLNNDDLDLDDDEEDSFALAVKRFEEMEKEGFNQQGFVPPKLDATTNAQGEALAPLSLAEMGLDEAILNSLRSGLSVEQIKEILVSFYEKADELVADIGKAYLDGENVALNARAHELKGMAGNFGFSGLSRMCAIIERAAKDNKPEEAKESIDLLGETYALARTQLNLWLEK